MGAAAGVEQLTVEPHKVQRHKGTKVLPTGLAVFRVGSRQERRKQVNSLLVVCWGATENGESGEQLGLLRTGKD